MASSCQNSKCIRVFFPPIVLLRGEAILRGESVDSGEGKCQINNGERPRKAVEEATEMRRGRPCDVCVSCICNVAG